MNEGGELLALRLHYYYCRNYSQPSDFPRLTPIHRRHQLATNMATSTKNPADDTKKEKGIAL